MAAVFGKHDVRCVQYKQDIARGLGASWDDSTPAFALPNYPPEYSKAPLPTCPETCSICAEHYLPLDNKNNPVIRIGMAMHNDAQALIVTQGYVKIIRANLQHIKQRIDAHGDALQSRWRRRNPKQRAALIRTAMPQIYGQNFAAASIAYDLKRKISVALPDQLSARHYNEKVLQNVKSAKEEHDEKTRNNQFLPYLDLQTLSENPASLLALLHNRSHTDPANWAMFDREHLEKAPSSYNPHCVVMYGKFYGSLIAWNAASAHRQDIIGYPRAALILEAQQILTTFLRKMVDLVLANGLEAATQGRAKWDALAMSDFQTERTAGSLSRRLGAFRAPPCYKIDDIVQRLRERCEVMFEELLLQQRDSLYFRNYLVRVSNTAFMAALDEETRQKQAVTHALGYISWTDVMRVAHDQAKFAQSVQKAHEDQVKPGKPLPAEYACALKLLEQHLTTVFAGQLEDLRRLRILTRTFEAQHSYKGGQVGLCKIDNREELFRLDPLLWNVIGLEDDRDREHEPTFYLEYLDYLMSESRDHKRANLDDLLATHISNMTLIDDILTAIRCHRPQPELSSDDELLKRLAKLAPPDLPELVHTGFAYWWPEKDTLWPPLKALLDVPLPNAKLTRASLAQRKDLRRASETFWGVVTRTMIGRFALLGESTNQIYGHVQLVMFTRTKDYEKEKIEEEETWERALKLQEAEQARLKQTIQSEAPTEPCLDAWRLGETAQTDYVERKQKAKTRPADAGIALVEEIEEQLHAIHLQEPRVKLAVKAESKELFDSMFTSSAELADVSWLAFVAAMIDAGCSAVPNGGSAVTFRQTTGTKAAIGFHRPHPDATISSVLLRSMGKRLAARFGWDEETFMEREKNGVK
ncbi:hypothetical protein LTR17_005038 [Elasticomyces elasticus]|nr:hypothetical protein LTR17_005038 [Elasticomyces elasticus]